MSGLSAQEADELARFLNQLCSATLEALASQEPGRRPEVAATLREVAARFDEVSEVGTFIGMLALWLEGSRPSPEALAPLNQPFRGALKMMLEQAGQEVVPPTPPLARSTILQLVGAVVAARVAGDEAVSRELATRLITIQGQLDEEWRPRLAPLLENLRALLGGAEPRGLPPVPDPDYQPLWLGAIELLMESDLRPERARDQLLERLVHNSRMVERSGEPELIAAFLRALRSLQREAVEGEAPLLATLVGAIQARLEGRDPTPFAALLEGDELAAWQQIVTSADE